MKYQVFETIEGEKSHKSFPYFHEHSTPVRSNPAFNERNFVIEGIGSGHFGCLCRPELDEHPECKCYYYTERYGEYGDHECEGQDFPKYTTNRVFDKDGNVIYTTRRCNLDIPYQLALSNVDSCILDTEWKMDDRQLRFKANVESLELTVYGTEGMACGKAIGSGTVEYNLSGLRSGIYIAVVQSDGLTLSTKKICVR